MANQTMAFQRAMQIKPVGSHEYEAVLDAEYSIGPVAHGGCMAALLANVVNTHFSTTLASLNQPDTLSSHSEFLRRGKVGKAVVKVQDIKLGKQMSTILLLLMQDSENILLMTATNISRSGGSGLTVDTGYIFKPPAPPIDFTKVLSHQDRHWVVYTVPSSKAVPNRAYSKFFFAVRREPLDDGERYFTQQWARCVEPQQRFTTDMLGLVVDLSILPSENSIKDSPFTAAAVRDRALKFASGAGTVEDPIVSTSRRYVTLSSTLEIKRSLPDEGVEWLFARASTKAVIDGKVDIHCEILDASGRLVALSQQIWMAIELPPSAYLGSRTKGIPGKM